MVSANAAGGFGSPGPAGSSRLIGLEGSLLQIFLVIAGVSIAYFMPLPAALGVLETIQIFVFALFNSTAASAVALSILVRIKDVWWTLLGLGLLSVLPSDVDPGSFAHHARLRRIVQKIN